MDEYIFYADRIVSVSDPYINDNFVKSHSRPIEFNEKNQLLEIYKRISINNGLLSKLLVQLELLCNPNPVKVVDIGVFMGSFSNSISLASAELSVPVEIDAYEANPQLISSIVKNFQLYGSKVRLHLSGIGKKRGRMDLVVSPGRTIAGSLTNTAARKIDNSFSCEVDVLPLSEVLDDEAAIGLIKIDIEGFEVPAFSSIIKYPNKVHNIFIIEFAPWQAQQHVLNDIEFGDFLLNTYAIYNVGNWAWFSKATRIRTKEELVGANLGNGGSNTDLLLIPRSFDFEPF